MNGFLILELLVITIKQATKKLKSKFQNDSIHHTIKLDVLLSSVLLNLYCIKKNTAEHRSSFPCSLRMLLNKIRSYLVEKTTRTKEN